MAPTMRGPPPRPRLAPRPRPPSTGLIPMQNAAHQAPFGPFPSKDDSRGEIDRQTSGVVDMRGTADWRSVFKLDCGAFAWGQLNGETFIYLEGAAGGADASAGPIVIGLGVGEVPDAITVSARARRGGKAETAGDTDERLALIASSRFHR